MQCYGWFIEIISHLAIETNTRTENDSDILIKIDPGMQY